VIIMISNDNSQYIPKTNNNSVWGHTGVGHGGCTDDLLAWIIRTYVYCQILLFSFQQQLCVESHLVELICSQFGLFLCFFITIRVDHSGSF
jgi:hypothetical protein